MDCTVCHGYKLEPQELEPGLVVAGCLKCGGALVSLINYRFWVERHQPEAENEQALACEPRELNDSSEAKSCPKCARFMTKYQVGHEISNRLELCAHCDEAWLDRGEWTLLKALDLAHKLPKIFTDAWQRNIRRDRMQKLQAERYQKILGEDDFVRAVEFKQWLDRHPKRRDIKLYLDTDVS
ncbi:MAG: hypothetical protein R3183_11960 [Oleiphilaceae bacterium]|nr:hypothetical protein [Oleiphilaceae bacterium]